MLLCEEKSMLSFMLLIQCENSICLITWKHSGPICHVDFTRTSVILWFSNAEYEPTNLVWSSDLVWILARGLHVCSISLFIWSLCVTEVVSILAETSLRIRLVADIRCRLHFRMSKYEKMINLCSPYPTRCLLLLKTCTSCYLSWDRLINAPVINRAFLLSCPWEDLSTYPPKINIPDQWNTHKPATSSFSHPAQCENKPQLVRFWF